MIAVIDGAAAIEARTYVMAATLVPEAECDSLRRRLHAALLPGQRRFHWHRESNERRLRFLEVIGNFDLDHRVRVVKPVRAWMEIPWSRPLIYRGGNGRWDLARGVCLLSLCADALIASTASQLVIVSRGQRNDLHDRRNLTDRRPASGNVRAHWTKAPHHFASPSDDALLWIPDAVAGAVLAHEARDIDDYVDCVPAWRRQGLLRRRSGRLHIAKVSW